MASTYVQYFQDPELGPPVMHGPNATARWTSLGAVMDNQTTKMKTAAKLRGPDFCTSIGASDALDEHGKDRLLSRGGTTPAAIDESDAAYAARLDVAPTTWEKAGMPVGILRALKIAGFPVEPTDPYYWTTGVFLINHNGRIVQLVKNELTIVGCAGPCVNRQNLLGAVSGIMNGFTLEARDQFYSRFCLLFVQDVPTLVNTEGNPVKACLNQIVQRWRSGGADYVGAVVCPSGNFLWGWPLGATWGTWRATWGTGVSARIINPT
jgi:hypothetical protein